MERVAANGPALGQLFVVSGPSGAGKTVLCARMLERYRGRMTVSISATSRAPRAGEAHGRDYFFHDRPTMEKLICEDQLAEWALVHDNYYGTPKSFLEENRRQGIHVLLNIDVQGSRKLCQAYPEAVTIFIAPPSLEILRDRLRKRNSDSEEVLRKRLQNARIEMECEKEYRHIVVNDELEAAINELTRIIETYLPTPGA